MAVAWSSLVFQNDPKDSNCHLKARKQNKCDLQATYK